MAITDNTQPVSGHGIKTYITLDPVGAPGAFTQVPHVTGSLPFTAPRTVTKSTPHDKDVPYAVLGPKDTTDLPLTINYVSSEPTHAFLWEAYNEGTFIGLQRVFSSGIMSDGGVIQSGYISAANFTHDEREGIRKMEATFVPSGPYWVDGTLVGDDPA